MTVSLAALDTLRRADMLSALLRPESRAVIRNGESIDKAD